MAERTSLMPASFVVHLPCFSQNLREEAYKHVGDCTHKTGYNWKLNYCDLRAHRKPCLIIEAPAKPGSCSLLRCAHHFELLSLKHFGTEVLYEDL